jgi:hypothetical protein
LKGGMIGVGLLPPGNIILPTGGFILGVGLGLIIVSIRVLFDGIVLDDIE